MYNIDVEQQRRINLSFSNRHEVYVYSAYYLAQPFVFVQKSPRWMGYWYAFDILEAHPIETLTTWETQRWELSEVE